MRIVVTGSAGYVASNLIPRLLENGHEVSGIDLFPADYGAGYWHRVGDMRDMGTMQEMMIGFDAAIHLACISNDPSFDMNPEIGKSINYDCFRPLVKAAKDAGIRRFIFASSSSVYGVREEKDVIETTPLTPLTDYSKYKALCEDILLQERETGFETVIIRPATVCGYAPNIRLDLCVHILTMAALRNKVIRVFGGGQYRPNIHIDDIVQAYINVLSAPSDRVNGEIFNVGTRNLTIQETAEMVCSICGGEIISEPLFNDPRSYHISSAKYDAAFPGIRKTVESAILSIKEAFEDGRIADPDNEKYYAIKRMRKALCE